MLFSIEKDEGNLIEGYVVPDGFSDKPSICVLDGDEEVAVLDCNRQIDAVVASGRHDTGWVGFRIDDTIVPDLELRRNLAIIDRRSGVLIYRRPIATGQIERRVFRLETQVIPFSRFDKALEPRFQYWSSGIERFGHETALQIFHLAGVGSIYASGRVLVRNYEYFLDHGFDFVTILSDPYVELAERIVFFRSLRERPSNSMSERDRMIFGPMIQHFSDADLTAPTVVKNLFSRAAPEVQRLVTSPLTRQLSSSQPDQVPNRKSLAPAMDLLSRFSVVGLREVPEPFVEAFTESIGIEPASVPMPTVHKRIAAVADMLREIPSVEILLELDLILYHFARQVIGSNEPGPTDQGRQLVWN